MTRIQRNALVPYSAKNMYKLVNDVASYPEFLPGCAESRIDEKSDQHMRASLLVKKTGISQWFTTVNTLQAYSRIDMSLVAGPFKHLSGGWTFTSLDEQACKIDLSLSFEFESKLVALAFGKVFESLTSGMVKAFTERAKEIYQ